MDDIEVSPGVLVKPKGVFKILQLIFVICAFSLTCDFRGYIKLHVQCNGNDPTTTRISITTSIATTISTPTTTDITTTPDSTTTHDITTTPGITTTLDTSTTSSSNNTDDTLTTLDPNRILDLYTTFKYPFKLYKYSVANQKNCAGDTTSLFLEGDYSPAACFYVFVGVFAMLYSLIALTGYLLKKEMYESNEYAPIADLVMHVLFLLLWLGGSIAWAVSVAEIKKYTRYDHMVLMNPMLCVENNSVCSLEDVKWIDLDFSVIFGFCNVILYGVNCLVIYRETKFFEGG